VKKLSPVARVVNKNPPDTGTGELEFAVLPVPSAPYKPIPAVAGWEAPMPRFMPSQEDTNTIRMAPCTFNPFQACSLRAHCTKSGRRASVGGVCANQHALACRTKAVGLEVVGYAAGVVGAC